MRLYLCSLPNTKSPGRPPELISEDPSAIAAFTKKWDIPGRAVYACPNPLKPGATRRLIETIDSITVIQVDIDFKDIVETPEEVDAKLRHLPLEPTRVRDSGGGGRHVIFELKDPVPHSDPEHFERVCETWKRLVAAMSADPAPSHPAALFRVEGTHNSKREGEPQPCKALWGSDNPVDLSEIEALIDLLPETGMFTLRPHAGGNGQDTAQSHSGRRAKVNVDQRLADMRFGGAGQAAVHNTELSCTSSLLRKGMSLDSAVLTVLEEAQERLSTDQRTKEWVWATEKRTLEGQCFDFIAKHPELAPALPDEFQGSFDHAIRSGKRPRFIFNKLVGRWHMRALGVVKGGLEANDRSEPPERPKEGETRGDNVEATEAPKYRFKLVPFASLKPGPEPLYLVDELIPPGGLVDVWGKAKCYKSFWCLDLMLHVAMGWEYRDRSVRQGAVVYCAFEGAHGYKKRIEALRRHYAIEEDASVPLYVMPGQANLIAEHRLLIADISAQLGEVKPVAVVLDTLNKSLWGSESKDEDMGNYVRAAGAIHERFGCVVIIVHHCGYDETRPRGHSSLPGAVDAQLSVVREESIVTVTVEMMRDGPEDTQVVSKTEVIEVGQDQNGKALTSLVVTPSEAPGRDVHGGWPRSLAVFHAATKSAIAANGEHFQPEPGVLAVSAADLEHIRDHFYATYAEAEEDESKRQEKIRRAFNRALGEAQRRGLIKVRRVASGPCGGRTLIWLPSYGEDT